MNSVPLHRPRDIRRVAIEKLAPTGEGIARTSDGTGFVSGSLPGEEAEVEITERRARFWRGASSSGFPRPLIAASVPTRTAPAATGRTWTSNSRGGRSGIFSRDDGAAGKSRCRTLRRAASHAFGGRVPPSHAFARLRAEAIRRSDTSRRAVTASRRPRAASLSLGRRGGRCRASRGHRRKWSAPLGSLDRGGSRGRHAHRADHARPGRRSPRRARARGRADGSSRGTLIVSGDGSRWAGSGAELLWHEVAGRQFPLLPMRSSR